MFLRLLAMESVNLIKFACISIRISNCWIIMCATSQDARWIHIRAMKPTNKAPLPPIWFFSVFSRSWCIRRHRFTRARHAFGCAKSAFHWRMVHWCWKHGGNTQLIVIYSTLSMLCTCNYADRLFVFVLRPCCMLPEYRWCFAFVRRRRSKSPMHRCWSAWASFACAWASDCWYGRLLRRQLLS